MREVLYTIYALVDPREPTVFRYIGRTSQLPAKRLSDHKSMARRPRKKTFRLRDWIRELQADGVEPEQVILFRTRQIEEACEMEADLALFHRDTVHNYFHEGAFRSGRRVDPQAHIHKITDVNGKRIPQGPAHNRKATRVDGQTFISQRAAREHLLAQGFSAYQARLRSERGTIRKTRSALP